jgi:putative ABC transport system ATP-binding protein
VISTSGLKRAYADPAGPVEVLRGVELTIAAGEFTAITGRSGSGKSTLLHVLGGLDSEFEGHVSVAGTTLEQLDDAALSTFRNEQVGFVFQSFHLVQGLSAVDNVALPSFFSRAGRGSGAAAEEALARVGLDGKRARTPGQLSGGERQRVAIARALFSRPRVLLCDEPTGNLDATTADEIIALFSELNRAGLTIVAVTHEDRLRGAASRVLTLVEGRLTT